MDGEQLTLKPNHTWRCKPGYKICVLDRGAVRFDFPSHWVIDHSEGSVMLHDRKPSIESCDLGVSIFHIPASMLPPESLDQMLTQSLGSDRVVRRQSEIRHIKRPDLEIAWLEQEYFETTQKRDARFRVAIGRGSVHVLITMNYWLSKAPTLERVWDEVMRTLVMGIQVKDPALGPVTH